jgi:hypothetical protein
MTDVLITPAFVSTKSDDPSKPDLLGPSEWNAPRLLGGGNPGDLVTRDPNASTGASWAPPFVVRPDGSVPFTANQSMGGHNLITLTDPVNPQDAATKNYVDAQTAAHDSGFRKLTYVGQRIGFPVGAQDQITPWHYVIPANTFVSDGQVIEFFACGSWGTQLGQRQVYMQINPADQPGLNGGWVTINASLYSGGPGGWALDTRLLRSGPSELVCCGLQYGDPTGEPPLKILDRQALDLTRTITIEIDLIMAQPSDGSFGIESLYASLL